MHYIWKRFVNVIFVRQYEQFLHGNRSSTTETAFELTTVPYPLPINEIFVTKRLDFWHNGRFQHGRKLNLKKTGDLEGTTQMIFYWIKWFICWNPFIQVNEWSYVFWNIHLVYSSIIQMKMKPFIRAWKLRFYFEKWNWMRNLRLLFC